MGAYQGGESLTPEDQVLFRGEKESRTRAGMVTVFLLDRAPDWEKVVAAFDRASREVPRLRQKVVEPTLPTTLARWVVDPDFDLRYHLRRRVSAGDGSHRELLDLAEQIAMTPLDLHRPLWVVTFVTGLEGGRAAAISNMSHAVADGAGLVTMFRQVCDTERDAPVRPLPLEPVPHDLEPRDLAIAGVKDVPGLTLGLTKTVVGAGLKSIADPVGSVGAVASYAASLGRVVGSFASPGTPSPLLAGRGAARRSVTLDLDLPDLRSAAHALGGTVNDAYIAGVCAVLRRYHEAKGVPVDQVPMAIPVSVRRVDQDHAGGNHWTGLALSAPVGEFDPAARVARIHETIQAGREEPALDVLGTVSTVLSLLPGIVFAPALEALTPVDVQASNVMSAPEDIFLAGAQVIGHYGLGPVPGIAVMFVLVSQSGRAFVTARYDTASIQDDETFERSLQEGFEEVLIAGRPVPKPIATPKQPTRAARVGAPAARKKAAKKTTRGAS
ncbi:MAG: wax ester/triacylglycerol synthase domain-containing protein [Tetrasphaera sp.]